MIYRNNGNFHYKKKWNLDIFRKILHFEKTVLTSYTDKKNSIPERIILYILYMYRQKF